MAFYATYEYYKSIYGEDAISESDFNRLSWEACHRIDILTTNKLKFAFPTNEDDVETVKRCACNMVEIAAQIEAANKRAADGQGYVTDENGTHGKIVSSVTSGSESVSYTAKVESGSTLIDAVLPDKSSQDRLYRDTVREYLAFVPDANGVNLLFAGPYPGKREVWK